MMVVSFEQKPFRGFFMSQRYSMHKGFWFGLVGVCLLLPLLFCFIKREKEGERLSSQMGATVCFFGWFWYFDIITIFCGHFAISLPFLAVTTF